MRISWFTSLWCLRWDRCSCIGQLFGEFLPRWMPHRLQQHDPGDSAFDDATQTEPNRLEAPCLQWFMWLARRGLCAIILKFVELWFGNLWDILTCEAMPELMEGSLLNDSPCFGQRSKRLTRGNYNVLSESWATHLKDKCGHCRRAISMAEILIPAWLEPPVQLQSSTSMHIHAEPDFLRGNPVQNSPNLALPPPTAKAKKSVLAGIESS